MKVKPSLPATLSVKKNVAMIHTSGTLGLLEGKIYNVLLLQAYDDLLMKREHSMPVITLSALAGYDSNDVGKLKAALKKMATTAIEYNLMGDGTDKQPYMVTSMIARGVIAGGVVTWVYDEELAKKLYDPEVFAHINLLAQQKFTRSYTLSLYENCARYRSVGSTGWHAVDKWRRLLGATADLYDEFKRLNAKVIQPAVKESNEYSEIWIEPEFRYERKGRSRAVTHIRFLVKDHPQRTLLPMRKDEAEVHREDPAYNRLRALGVSDRVAVQAVQSGDGYAAQVASYVEERARAGVVRRPGAYAARLIEAGAVVKPPAIVEEVAKQKSAAERQRGVEAHRSRYLQEFQRERRERFIGSLSADRRAALIEEFLRDRKGSSLRGYDPATHQLTGFALASFESFAVLKVLGEHDNAALDAWISERVKTPRGTP